MIGSFLGQRSMKTIRAGTVDIAYFEEGQGPLVVLLHGFPDTAHGWAAAVPGLVAGGYRVVRPNLRGYYPSSFAPDGRYDMEVLGNDLLSLVDALGEESARVVANDWGAAGAYCAAAKEGARFEKLVTIASPHPRAIAPTPKMLWRMRHFFELSAPGAVGRLRNNDCALVDRLVARWSPAWDYDPEEQTRPVKSAFSEPGCAEAAISYYRQLGPKPPAVLNQMVPVSTVLFAGEQDGAMPELDPYERSREFFSAPVEIQSGPGGHFMHREHPEWFMERLLSVL